MRLRRCIVACAVTALLTLPSAAFAYSHYGRTTQAVTLKGRVLPPGSYVPLAFDDRDAWVTSEISSEAQRIPKSAVDPIPNVQFSPALTGRANQATRVYHPVPDVSINPATLEEPLNNISIPKGVEFKILFKQGNDYIVQLPPSEGSVLGRVPVAVVDIISGSPASGRTDPILLFPRPIVQNFTQPAHPAPRSLPSPGLSLFGTLAAIVAIISLLLPIVIFFFDHMAHQNQGDTASATTIDPKEWSVDPNTGEYHRVTYSAAEGRLIDTRSYHEIASERLRLLRTLNEEKRLSAVCGVASLVLLFFAIIAANSDLFVWPLILTIGSMIFCFSLILVAAHWLGDITNFYSAQYRLPPPPLPAPGLDDVERQMAYGDAGPAGIEDIHKALSGRRPDPRSTTPRRIQSLPRPQFEE